MDNPIKYWEEFFVIWGVNFFFEKRGKIFICCVGQLTFSVHQPGS
jgi:hypothetical protein